MDLTFALENSESISFALKPVLENGTTEEAINKLGAYVISQDQEIELICNRYYSDLLKSLNGLITVKQDIANIRTKISEISTAMIESGTDLKNKAKELEDLKTVQRNINAAIELMKHFQQFLVQVETLELDIQRGKFHSALKVIEDLRTEYIPTLNDFTFVKILEMKLPNIETLLRNSIIEDVGTWFLHVWKLNSEIGEQALELQREKMIGDQAVNVKMTEKLLEHKALVSKREMVQSFVAKPADSTTLEKEQMSLKASENIFIKEEQTKEKEIKDKKEESQEDNPKQKKKSIFKKSIELKIMQIDFAPLYQGIFLHKKMNRMDVLYRYYTENRKLQLSKIFQSNLRGYAFLAAVGGHFIVEHMVYDTTEKLFTAADVSSPLPTPAPLEISWKICETKVKNALLSQVSDITDQEELVKFNTDVMLFGEVMRSYGYDTSLIAEFLENSFERYSAVLLDNYKVIIKTLLETNYGNKITNTDVIEKIQKYGLATDLNLRVGDTTPFTLFVVNFCEQLENFYLALMKYVTPNINIAATSTNVTETLFKSLIESIDPQKLTIQRNIQLAVDIHHICKSEKFFQGLITRTCGTTPALPFVCLAGFVAGAVQSELGRQGAAALRRTVAVGVPHVLAATHTPHATSTHVADIITYLIDFLGQLKPLPIDSVLNSVFKLIALMSDLITEMLTGDSVKKITLNGLKQLEIDIEYLQEFMEKDERLRASVSHLDQILQIASLIVNKNIDKYFCKGIQMTEYFAIEPRTLKAVLQKLSIEKKLFKSLSKEQEQFNESVKNAIARLGTIG